MGMDALSLVFTVASLIGIGLLIWAKTDSGKKWIASL